jgi:hypothetical protein
MMPAAPVRRATCHIGASSSSARCLVSSAMPPMRVNVINAHFLRGTTPRQPIRLQYPVSSGGKRFQRSFLWWAAQGTRTDYP